MMNDFSLKYHCHAGAHGGDQIKPTIPGEWVNDSLSHTSSSSTAQARRPCFAKNVAVVVKFFWDFGAFLPRLKSIKNLRWWRWWSQSWRWWPWWWWWCWGATGCRSPKRQKLRPRFESINVHCTTNCSVGIQNIMLDCNIKKNTKYKPDYLKHMHFCKIENSASIKCKNCAEVTSADLDRVCLHWNCPLVKSTRLTVVPIRIKTLRRVQCVYFNVHQ